MFFSLVDNDLYDVPAVFPHGSRCPLRNRLQQPEYNRNQRRNPATLSQVLNQILNNNIRNEEIEIAEEKNKYKLMLDVQQFAPSEISVKVVDDFVVVEGSHEDKEDEHGWISRKFTRRYQIPKQWDIDQLTSKLSSDGVLTILAPKKTETNASGEKVINIQHTGKPAVQAKPQPKKDEESN